MYELSYEWKKEFSKRIRRKMVAKNMKQRDLANAAGIHEVTLSRYICCTRTPPIRIVIKLAHALECEVDYLIHGVSNCLYLKPNAVNQWDTVFVTNLIHNMQENNITRQRLAAKTGLSYLSVYYYLIGNKIPSLPAVMRICEVFDCTVGEMLENYDY